MTHTPGPWKWCKDWDAIDKVGTVYHETGDGYVDEIEKYMDLQLVGPNGRTIIPIRIDHYQIEWDGDPISPADRALIAAAPKLLEVCEETLNLLASLTTEGFKTGRDLPARIKLSQAIAEAKGGE